MFRASLLSLFSLLPATALAGGLSVGVGADFSADMPDRADSIAYSKGFVGGGLMVPVRYDLSPYASARATVRTAFAPGHDRVSWGVPIPSTSDPTELRYASTEHWSMLAAAGLTIGLEASTKEEGLSPYFGAETGPVIVNTYHSFGPESGTQVIIEELGEEALSDSGTVEPFTSQVVLLTDLHAGVRTKAASGVGFWAEAGYHAAFVGAKPLEEAAHVAAQRDAYGWNAIRLGGGVLFSF